MNKMVGVVLLSMLLLGCISAPDNQGTGTEGNQERDLVGIEKNGGVARPEIAATSTVPTEAETDSKLSAFREVPVGGQAAPTEIILEKSVYAPFSKAEYEGARGGRRVIFLYFFANWCPICKAEKPNLDATLSSLPYKNVAAFIVNYKDSETDADEEALARQFNVPYQHTTIIFDSGGAEKFRSLSPLSGESILNELEKAGAE